MTFTESTKLFRAYDPINKKFAFVGLDFRQLANIWDFENDKHIKITQFTGLKDSKGNDIYEGDIIQTTGFVFDDREKTTTSEMNIISLIEFCPKKSCFVTVSPKYGGVHGLLFMDILEIHEKQIHIIGNYYGTPELLE